MARRVHVDELRAGEVTLSRAQSNHVRNVLRMGNGDSIEVFDSKGATGSGTIRLTDDNAAVVDVREVTRPGVRPQLTIASAIPKRDRADWMIEKLSEIGVSRFIPLLTDRSIVEPKGQNKLDRWRRIAIESAKQSQREGVMQIEEPTPLKTLLPDFPEALVLSTQSDALLLQSKIKNQKSKILLIGPEGGWSDDELRLFRSGNLTAVRLTTTILRIETAAILAAGIVAVHLDENQST